MPKVFSSALCTYVLMAGSVRFKCVHAQYTDRRNAHKQTLQIVPKSQHEEGSYSKLAYEHVQFTGIQFLYPRGGRSVRSNEITSSNLLVCNSFQVNKLYVPDRRPNTIDAHYGMFIMTKPKAIGSRTLQRNTIYGGI